MTSSFDSQNHAILRNFVYLKGFTVKTLRKFLDNVEVLDVPPQAYLCQQGDPFTHFYLIIFGQYEMQWTEFNLQYDQ